MTGRNRKVLKDAGFKAAGHGALHLLGADPAAAGKGGAPLSSGRSPASR